MRYELSGTLRVVKDTQVVSDRFKKREFVVMIDEESQFPQPIMCQFTQDRCSKLESYNAGDKVKVEFYLKGREWTSPQGDVKYFISADAWSIEKLGGNAEQVVYKNEGSSSADIPPPPSPTTFENINSEEAKDDDLPF
jgi:single-stranded DNA-binding protein